jgi:hypothetical protein
MQSNLIQDAAIGEHAAEAQPGSRPVGQGSGLPESRALPPSFDFPASADSLRNAAPGERDSPVPQPRRDAARGENRRKPKAIHWESFLQTCRRSGKPES